MNINVIELLKYLGINNIWFVFFIVLALFYLVSPEKLEYLRKGILKAFSFLGSAIRRKYHVSHIKTSLTPSINYLQAQLNSDEPLPPVQVRYYNDKEDKVGEFRDGTVFVFLRDNLESKAANVTNAAISYVNTCVYPETRPLMDLVTNKAFDLALTRRMLMTEQDALYYFNHRYIPDICKENDKLRKIYTQLLAVDDKGFFASILIHQLMLLSARLGPTHMFSPRVQQEVFGFIHYLSTIASRERGERVQLNFEITYIRVGCILLGADETLNAGGFSPYLRQASRMVLGEFHGFYVLGAGHKIGVAEDFLLALSRNNYLSKRISVTGLEEQKVKFAKDKQANIGIAYVHITPRNAYNNNDNELRGYLKEVEEDDVTLRTAS